MQETFNDPNSSATGGTTMQVLFPGPTPGSFDFSHFGFDLRLGGVGLNATQLYPYIVLHLQESSDGGTTYNTISTIPGENVIGSPSFSLTLPKPVSGRSYRARLYMPILGIYFYLWSSHLSAPVE